MRHILFFLLGVLLLSCKQDFSIEPSSYLSPEEQTDFKYAIARYVHRLPKKATFETKFNEEFDEEYRKRAENTDLLFYHQDKKTGETYFAVAKIAPSIALKKVVTAGKLRMGSDGVLHDYEEAFRTWKMEEAEGKEVSEMLFLKYIKKEDLSPYYTRNANGKFYIEFPDENVSYDKSKRTWVSKLTDPLEGYYDLKQLQGQP